jgi:hypothetical protein
MKTFKIIFQFCLMLVIFNSCEENSLDEKPVSLRDKNARLNTDYKLDGTEGDPIPLETASDWIANFGKQNPEGTIAHFFGFEIIKQILEEEGAVGIRMYYAIDDKGSRQIILVGVNAQGDDLLPAKAVGGRISDDGIIIADASYPCPTYCSGDGNP